MAPAVLDVGLTGRTSSRGLIGATIRAEVHDAVRRQNAGAPSAVTGDVFRQRVIQQRLDLRNRAGWREGKVWSGVQRLSHWSGPEAHDRILMQLQQAQVGIGASHLHSKQLLDVFRLRDREAALAGAELHQNKLVIFATLQLERATVGPIRNDRVPDVRQRQGTSQPGGITRGQVTDELPEESLEIAQLPSVI